MQKNLEDCFIASLRNDCSQCASEIARQIGASEAWVKLLAKKYSRSPMLTVNKVRFGRSVSHFITGNQADLFGHG